MSSDVVINSVGSAFITKVRGGAKLDDAGLRAEFAEFSRGLSGELRGPLANFVRQELALDPLTAWMAEALQEKRGATCVVSSDAEAARSTLAEIAQSNHALNDKTIRSGLQIVFANGEQHVKLSEVAGLLAAKTPLEMVALKYEKASGWLIGVAMCLGGSWPVMEGVNLNNIRQVHQVVVNNPSELAAAWKDARLNA